MTFRNARGGMSVLVLVLATAGLSGQGGTPEVRDLFDLEREYIRARGGRVMMDETRTALVRGRFVQQETVVSFSSYRRRPNLYRMDISLSGTEVREGFDGTTPWRAFPTAEGRRVERLSGDEAARMVREAEFESPLVNHREKTVNLSYGGTERVGDRTCHVVRMERRGWAAEVWYLDIDTLLEVESHRIGAEGSAVITRYHDWRKVEGRQIPHRVETYLADELISVTIIDRVQWNIGILSDLFRVPE